ncbi:MAG: flagellar FlbD family protein [Ilumatobacter sp.]
MIQLTRLGQQDRFFLNPDLIERIDCHVDSIVRLTNGVEYVVAESGEQIVERIVNYRSQIAGTGPTLTRPAPDAEERSEHERREATVVELPTNREAPR